MKRRQNQWRQSLVGCRAGRRLQRRRAAIEVTPVIEKLAEVVPRKHILHPVDLPGVFRSAQRFVDELERLRDFGRFTKVKRGTNPVKSKDERMRKALNT